MKSEFLNGRVIVKVGDLTKETVDAIVNAANRTLYGGGGVDGAIHRIGGKEILKECEMIRKTVYAKGLPTGKAVITTGGKLKAQFVIHTVGPIYGQEDGEDAQLLANAYINSLVLASDKKLKTVAFPSISTGAFYYPKHEAAEISSKAIKTFLSENTQLEMVILVFYSESYADTFMKHQVF